MNILRVYNQLILIPKNTLPGNIFSHNFLENFSNQIGAHSNRLNEIFSMVLFLEVKLMFYYRLQEEPNFLDLAERVQNYYEKVNKIKRASRIAARRIEHLYYKLDTDTSKYPRKPFEKYIK